jgi:hypothetical protein
MYRSIERYGVGLYLKQEVGLVATRRPKIPRRKQSVPRWVSCGVMLRTTTPAQQGTARQRAESRGVPALQATLY